MKSIVLSSGGIDSTTCLSLVVSEQSVSDICTVSVLYGQKHKRELFAANCIANYFKVRHYELNLAEVLNYSDCALLSASHIEMSHKSYAEQMAEFGKVSTYVPFRNGLMLSAVATLAVSLYPDEEVNLYLGVHADDAAGNAYPDCSQEFVSAMNQAVNIGTYNKVSIIAPFVGMNKSAVVAKGLKLKTPYELTWSCYEGGERPCGVCATCLDRAAAFAANGVKDPALTV